jgi:hypothetical protein
MKRPEQPQQVPGTAGWFQRWRRVRAKDPAKLIARLFEVLARLTTRSDRARKKVLTAKLLSRP